MSLNPSAVFIWVFAGLVGYLVGGDVHSAIVGAVSAMGISIFLTIFF